MTRSLGGFSDGTYGYCVPYYSYTLSSGSGPYGKVARFELDASPFSSSAVTVLDVKQVSANYHGFFYGMDGGDGHGYLFPYYDGDPCSNSHVVRFSFSDFTTASVSAIDTGYACARGGFTDGTGYLYVVPHGGDGVALHSNVVRVDMDSFVTADMTTLNLNADGQFGEGCQVGFAHGGYAYFGAGYNSKVLRVDLSTFSSDDCEIIDLSSFLGSDARMYRATHDSMFAYFSDGDSGVIVRIKLSDAFVLSNVEVALDLGSTGLWIAGNYGGMAVYGTWAYTHVVKADPDLQHNIVRFGVNALPSYEPSRESSGF